MFDRPGGYLVGLPVGAAVAVSAASISLLEEALVVPFELVVEDDPSQPPAAARQAVRRLTVGAIHLRVVLQFARLPHPRVERLAGSDAAFARPALRFQEIAPSFGERHDPVAVTGPRDGVDEAVLPKMPQVGRPVIASPTEARLEVV
jgi:hypothetical protein